MSNLDKSIADALGEEPEIGEFGDEQSLLDQVTATFRTKNRWIVVYGMVMAFAIMGVFVYALLEFLEVKETLEALPWAVLMIFAFMAMAAIKLWYYMEINKNAVLREVVRLERRVEQMHQELMSR